MATKQKSDFYSYKVDGVYNRITTSVDSAFYTGDVVTSLGIVWVVATKFARDHGGATFGFVYKGREYRHRVGKQLTLRGMATIAHRFAKDVVKQADKSA